MDAHFQVNYLSQFMLTLNLLDLLEKSTNGGRVIFNASETGEIFWNDMQMRDKWNFEEAIHQGMVAKRMFMQKLHRLYTEKQDSKVSFICFQIHKTVWPNQINLIPKGMRLMANLAKLFGQFISMEESGEVIAPLFLENQKSSAEKSGTFLTWKNNSYIELKEETHVLDTILQDKLWKISVELYKN